MSGQDVMRTVGSGIVSTFNTLSDLCYKGFDKLFNWIGSLFHSDSSKSNDPSKSLTSSSDQDSGSRYQATANRMRSRRNDFSQAANTGLNSNYSMSSNMQTYPASRTSYASNMSGFGGQQFAFNVMPRFNENSAGMMRGFGGPQMAFAHGGGGGGCHFGGGRRGFHR